MGGSKWLRALIFVAQVPKLASIAFSENDKYTNTEVYLDVLASVPDETKIVLRICCTGSEFRILNFQQQKTRRTLDLHNSTCIRPFTMKAKRLSTPLSYSPNFASTTFNKLNPQKRNLLNSTWLRHVSMKHVFNSRKV